VGSQEKLQIGTVVSTKMDKTVVVRIDRHKRHRLYKKTISESRRYKAHDERNECNLGDVVRIAETRPLSREKRWRVVEIVTKGDVAELAPKEVGASLIGEIEAAQAERQAERERQEAAARAERAAMAGVEPEPEASLAEATTETDAPGADERAAASGAEPGNADAAASASNDEGGGEAAAAEETEQA
jgi:small subunit ribosomal protein S17